MKTIMKLLLPMLAMGWVQSAEISEGTQGLFIKGMTNGDNYYGMVGLGQYDGFGQNAGYFAWEKYGPNSEYFGDSNEDDEEPFYVERFTMKGEAYLTTETRNSGFLTGAKVDIYYGTTEDDDSDYEVNGFGMGIGLIARPIPMLKNLYITGGANIEPKFLSTKWESDSSWQHNWYADAEYFITSRFAAVYHYVHFRHGDSEESRRLYEAGMIGFRFSF